jgi:hypothetical protein
VKTLLLAVLLCALGPLAADADEVSFPDVQYLSGHAGMDKKMKGSLTLTERELTFTAKDGPAFTIPLADIREVTNSVEENPGSTGAKLMLGVFASKKEEFLYVNTENKDGAEALVFKTKNKTSPAMVAKIKFQVKKAAAAVDSIAVPAIPPPPTDAARVSATAADSVQGPK